MLFNAVPGAHKPAVLVPEEDSAGSVVVHVLHGVGPGGRQLPVGPGPPPPDGKCAVLGEAQAQSHPVSPGRQTPREACRGKGDRKDVLPSSLSYTFIGI